MPTPLEAAGLTPGALLDALEEPAVLFDASGTVRFANEPAAQWCGMRSSELVGSTLEAWRGCLARHFRLPPGESLPADGGPGAWSRRLESAGVPRRVFELRSAPLRGAGDGNGADLGRVEVLRNITAQARAETEKGRLELLHAREVEALKLRLEQAEKFKLELTANVTHDLRTPIASIKASVSGLLAGDVDYDPQELRETLTVIEEECDRLQRRVQNLLSMARMEAGDVDLSRDWADLADIAASAIEALKSLRGGRAITLEFGADLPMVLGDYIQLQIAVRNLIENALLYSPPDQPIEVSVTASLGQVRVRVRDYGAGLMPDEFERVFDKFYRGRSARRIPGTGLGLPICRGIAEAHGGRLWAEHAPGGGVAFVLSLPAGEEPPETE